MLNYQLFQKLKLLRNGEFNHNSNKAYIEKVAQINQLKIQHSDI